MNEETKNMRDWLLWLFSLPSLWSTTIPSAVRMETGWQHETKRKHQRNERMYVRARRTLCVEYRKMTTATRRYRKKRNRNPKWILCSYFLKKDIGWCCTYIYATHNNLLPKHAHVRHTLKHARMWIIGVFRSNRSTEREAKQKKNWRGIKA